MSTNLFTPEQEAFLKRINIDTNKPVFPLSCDMAERVTLYKNSIDKYDEALAIKARGGYESDEEHKKKYIDELFRSNYKSHKILFAVLSIIVGEILALILQFSIWVVGQFTAEHIGDYQMSTGASFFCWIMRFVFIILCFILFNKVSKNLFLRRNRENIQNEMYDFKFKVETYYRTLKESEESYQRCSENYAKLLELLKIITADREAIPESYWRFGSNLLQIYEKRLANNVSEAIRVFEEQRHQSRMEYEMGRQTELANQANIAAQQALQAARNAEATAGFAVSTANYAADRSENRY